MGEHWLDMSKYTWGGKPASEPKSPGLIEAIEKRVEALECQDLSARISSVTNRVRAIENCPPQQNVEMKLDGAEIAEGIASHMTPVVKRVAELEAKQNTFEGRAGEAYTDHGERLSRLETGTFKELFPVNAEHLYDTNARVVALETNLKRVADHFNGAVDSYNAFVDLAFKAGEAAAADITALESRLASVQAAAENGNRKRRAIGRALADLTERVLDLEDEADLDTEVNSHIYMNGAGYPFTVNATSSMQAECDAYGKSEGDDVARNDALTKAEVAKACSDAITDALKDANCSTIGRLPRGGVAVFAEHGLKDAALNKMSYATLESYRRFIEAMLAEPEFVATPWGFVAV